MPRQVATHHLLDETKTALWFSSASPILGIGPLTLGIFICKVFVQIEHKPNIYDEVCEVGVCQ